ncbi:SGNH/GDSL hydrolase family protein [Sphingobium sp. WCS2017Hpa-17]|uniref:SGNH/GDSL hydrolase family protein n=1 Tax=Sphingobium sp. WCS2017Hpa-17 TaxID=3073638 RepID=UPI00288930D1|nr:SGNH/GDSL hydrolase family protein [Sphingobium sp. WCS2017Hpa-17]
MRRLALLLLASCALVGTARAENWVPGWFAPAIGYEPAIRDALGRPYQDETVRQEVRVGTAGAVIRLRLSNELGDTPLTIGGVSVVRIDAGGKVVAGSLRRLAFAGQPSVIVPARAPMLSDPLPFAVQAGETLAFSVHYSGEAKVAAHAQMIDVAGPGDLTDREQLPSPRRARAGGIVSAVEVVAGASAVLVAFGDSITEGAGASPGKGMSWPDQLATLLGQEKAGRCWAVANAGISGNRLLHDGRGPNALARFDRDVLSVPGATHVVILEGINDIGKVSQPERQYQQVSAERIIGAYGQLLARAKARGLKVIIGTLLPYEGAAYADAAGEERRQTVNRWIRDNARSFDAVIDFDVAMQEPGQPKVMRLSDQIGDHLHPNDAGYARMAAAALPVLLGQKGCGQ